MDTQQYVVQVWKTENRIATNGADYHETVEASTPVEALKNILEAKGVSGMFYAEVCLEGDDGKRWAFNDLNPELNS